LHIDGDPESGTTRFFGPSGGSEVWTGRFLWHAKTLTWAFRVYCWFVLFTLLERLANNDHRLKNELLPKHHHHWPRHKKSRLITCHLISAILAVFSHSLPQGSLKNVC
jgi:hypothetical protein